MFRGNRKPRVLAHTLLRILHYINQEKFLGLDENPLAHFTLLHACHPQHDQENQQIQGVCFPQKIKRMARSEVVFEGNGNVGA